MKSGHWAKFGSQASCPWPARPTSAEAKACGPDPFSTSMEGSAVTHFAEKGGAGLTEVGRQWRWVRRQQGRRHQGAPDGESGGSYIG
jgi:hypothetical protein